MQNRKQATERLDKRGKSGVHPRRARRQRLGPLGHASGVAVRGGMVDGKDALERSQSFVSLGNFKAPPAPHGSYFVAGMEFPHASSTPTRGTAEYRAAIQEWHDEAMTQRIPL